MSPLPPLRPERARVSRGCELTLRLGAGALVFTPEQPVLYRDPCQAAGSGFVSAPAPAEGVAFVEALAWEAGAKLPPATQRPLAPLGVRYFGGPPGQECAVLHLDHTGWGPSQDVRLLLFRTERSDWIRPHRVTSSRSAHPAAAPAATARTRSTSFWSSCMQGAGRRCASRAGEP